MQWLWPVMRWNALTECVFLSSSPCWWVPDVQRMQYVDIVTLWPCGLKVRSAGGKSIDFYSPKEQEAKATPTIPGAKAQLILFFRVKIPLIRTILSKKAKVVSFSRTARWRRGRSRRKNLKELDETDKFNVYGIRCRMQILFDYLKWEMQCKCRRKGPGNLTCPL